MMPKISIYVPDDLKARMDATGESTNWSAIAQRTFSVELKHLESVKEISTMSDVVERLKASKEQWVESEISLARECGVDWAKHHAEFIELRRMAGVNLDTLDNMRFENDLDYAFELYRLVVDDGSPNLDELAQFFLLDSDAANSITQEFVDSFCKAAISVWDEVAGQID